MLSDDDKRRIEEEEKYRASVRENLTQQPKKKGMSTGMGCLTLILVFIGLSIFMVALTDNKSTPKPSKSSNTPIPTKTVEQIQQEKKAQQKKIEVLSDTFCENRTASSGAYLKLEDYIAWEKGANVTLHNAYGVSAKKESCNKVAEICLVIWSENECGDIAERKIWIGMERNQLMLSQGIAQDENDTVGSWGIHTQWVYGDFGPYVYLEGKDEDNLKVTSWQN